MRAGKYFCFCNETCSVHFCFVLPYHVRAGDLRVYWSGGSSKARVWRKGSTPHAGFLMFCRAALFYFDGEGDEKEPPLVRPAKRHLVGAKTFRTGTYYNSI